MRRWALARVGKGERDADYPDYLANGTRLFVKGHASCIAEGLSVPWFFTQLDEKSLDYDLCLELDGAAPFPLPATSSSAKHAPRLCHLSFAACELPVSGMSHLLIAPKTCIWQGETD